MFRIGVVLRSFAIIGVVLSLAACFVPVGLIDDALELVVEETVYGYEATLDFGDVALEAGARTLAGTVTNTLGTDVTVTAATAAVPFTVTTPTVRCSSTSPYSAQR